MDTEEPAEPEASSEPAPVQLVTAGFLRRFVASLIDGLVLYPVTIPLLVIPTYPNVESPRPWQWGLLYAVWFAYAVAMLGRFGWTLGMRALKVRVSRADGGPVGYKCAAVRTLAYLLPGLAASLVYWTRWSIEGLAVSALCAVAVLWMIVDPRHQGYHDKIAGTFVVRGVKSATSAEAEPGMAPEVVTFPARRLLRVEKWAAFVALSLLGTSVCMSEVAMEIAASRVENQIHAIIADLKVEGVPLTAAEWVPPPLPDAENGALVFEQANDKRQLSTERGKALSKVLRNWQEGLPLGHEVTPEELDALATGKGGSEAPSGESPAAGAKAPGAAPAENAPAPPPRLVTPDPHMRAERQAGEPTDTEVLSAARRALAENSEAVALLHRAAGMQKWRPRSKSDEEYVPRTPNARRQAQLLEMEALVLSQDGDKEGSLRSAGDMSAIGDAVGQAPGLISPLIEMIFHRMAIATAERVLLDSTPSPSACRDLEERLSRLELRSHLVRGLESDLAQGLEGIRDLAESPDPVHAAAAAIGGAASAERPSGGRAGPRLLVQWWFASDELFYLRSMTYYVEQAKVLPFRLDPHLDARCDQIEARVESKSLLPPHLLSSVMLPFFRNALRRAGDDETTIDLTRVALLLKAYRGEHGEYPPSLDELQNQAGKELPLDPCSGQPFQYRRNGSGFILYTVGTDGVDDGGKVSFRAGQESPIPPLRSEKGADIVWVCKQ